MDGQRLDEMSLPELLELIRVAADAVETRAMQEAGEDVTSGDSNGK